VDIRVNAPELLEKEIILKKPKNVLLGSTTECFQPVERKYRLTKRILEILNKHKIYYCILTRSPYILDYIPLLKEGFCRKIYFTINKFKPEFKQRLEPKSPGLDLRDEAVNMLLSEGLPVIPYFSPLLPWVSDIKDVYLRFKEAKEVDFECLNFRLNNINEIINNINGVDSSLKLNYESMLGDRPFYAQVFKEIEKDIDKQAQAAKKRYNIYIHKFGDYFKNKYTAINSKFSRLCRDPDKSGKAQMSK
jgi:DNA repair photolyase